MDDENRGLKMLSFSTHFFCSPCESLYALSSFFIYFYSPCESEVNDSLTAVTVHTEDGQTAKEDYSALQAKCDFLGMWNATSSAFTRTDQQQKSGNSERARQ